MLKAKIDSEAIPHAFYDVHEERIRTKFEEEREKVQTAFKSMIDKLHDKEGEFVDMMKEQMEKELASLKGK